MQASLQGSRAGANAGAVPPTRLDQSIGGGPSRTLRGYKYRKVSCAQCAVKGGLFTEFCEAHLGRKIDRQKYIATANLPAVHIFA